MGIGKFEWGNPRYTTLVNNGDPDKRLDVTILGDGYAADDMHLYYQDVDSIIQSFHDIEPMKSYINHFNFHRVDVISQQSGVNDRWAKPKFKTKSALGSHFSIIDQRRLVGWDWRVWQVARRSGVPFDSLLVVVNTPRRGGATRFWMTVGYASRNSSDFPRIMIHEAGHSIAKLMDEYDYSLPAIPLLKGRSLPIPLPFANVTTWGRKPKWQEWIEPATPCPTPVAEDVPMSCIGAFEGASYCKYGAYKPTQECLMRVHSQPFCPICQEQWIKRIYRKSPIADAFAPERKIDVRVGDMVTFSAELVRPNAHIHTTYRLRAGLWHDLQMTHEYEPLTHQFTQAGRYTIELTLEDHSHKIRKPDVHAASRLTHQWQIVVRD